MKPLQKEIVLFIFSLFMVNLAFSQEKESIIKYSDCNIIKRDSAFYEYKKIYCKGNFNCLTPEEYEELYTVLIIRDAWNLSKNYDTGHTVINILHYFTELQQNNRLDLDTLKFEFIFGNEGWERNEQEDRIQYSYCCYCLSDKYRCLLSVVLFYFNRETGKFEYAQGAI